MKKILGFLLAFCMIIGLIPCTAFAADNFTVTATAGIGGKVSADGINWTDSVTVTVPAGEKVGNRINYRADYGYEPDSITADTFITAVTAGKNHTAIIDNAGQIYICGDNFYGQRAVGDSDKFANPSGIPAWQFLKPTNGIDGIKVKEVSAGQYHTVLLSEDGDVYTAGRNNSGQLGRTLSNTQGRDNNFAKVTVGDGNVKIKAVAASSEFNYAGHTVLIDENGKVWTAGNNYYKQLGRKTSAENNSEFKQAEGEVNNVEIVAAAAGTYQTILLDSTGQVWTVGSSMYGTNGQGPKTVSVFTKCTVEGNPKIIAVAAGDKHSVLLDENGNVYTTGYNNVGQLGSGDNTERNKFAKVPLTDNVKIVAVSAGKDFTVLLDENGKVYAAGNNDKGQLGASLTDNKTNTFVPVSVEGLEGNKIVSIAAGESHTVLLDNTGKIRTSGQNDNYQLGRLIKPYKANDTKFVLAMSSPAFQNVITDLTDFTVTGNQSINISFKEREKITVNYRLGSGNWISGYTPPTYYYKGDSFTAPALTNLARVGYNAKSWSILSQTDNSVTYTVNWEEKSGYTVKYNTNGGTETADKTNVNWNDEVLDGIENPAKEGWEFAGWTFNGEKVYNDEWGSPCYSELANSDTVSEITLDANWNDIKAPVINGLTDKKTYCSAVEFTATDNDVIDTVTVNGTPIQAENGKYTLLPADGEQTVVAKDKSGNNTQVIVTVNNGHTYEWQIENTEYWQKCKFCDDETVKKDIPVITINGSDRVCKTQDYKFNFTLPEGATDAKYGYVIENSTDDSLIPDFNNDLYSGVLNSDLYKESKNSFKLTVRAKTADGFEFVGEKTITIQIEHTGGIATCCEKAICEVCGSDYGEINADNHSQLKHFESKTATKESEGNIEYWYCEGCGKYYGDAAATKEIAKSETVTEKLKEEAKPDTTSPKTGTDGNVILLIAVLLAGSTITSVTVFGKKKKQNR